MKRTAVLAVAMALAFVTTPAFARHHHHKHHHHYRHHAVHHKHHHVRVVRHHHRRHRIHYDAVNSDTRIVSHPSGCPRRAFCGCGVSVWAFGKSVRSLWLAAAYYKFPRASPGAGMVAIFGRHHVAGILQVYGDGTALVYDPNSGGHQTRIHRRSIAHAVIVNPHRG